MSRREVYDLPYFNILMRSLDFVDMLKRIVFIGGLLAASVSVHSQDHLTLSECTEAVTHLSVYIETAIDTVERQYEEQGLSSEHFYLAVEPLKDFQNTHTLDHCMNGTYAEFFSCMNSGVTDINSCR